jgi:hypothetical protein
MTEDIPRADGSLGYMRGRGLRHHFDWPLSLDAVWLAGPLFLVAFAAVLSPVRPFDYFWALVQGRASLQLAAIPSQNLFLFTLPAHTPFFDQPWLAQLTMFGAYCLGGHAANVVLLAACLVLAFALSLDTALRLGASARGGADRAARRAALGTRSGRAHADVRLPLLRSDAA